MVVGHMDRRGGGDLAAADELDEAAEDALEPLHDVLSRRQEWR